MVDMANDKMNHQNVGAIAQAMKYQARTGDAWDNLSGAAKESIDQILSSIARTVSSGQGVHWEGIMAYADAAKGVADPLKTDRSFDYPYTTPPIAKPPPTAEIEHGIRNLVRELPRNGQ